VRAVLSEELSLGSPPIIETVDVQRNRAMIQPWLDNRQPFVVVGPEGCALPLSIAHGSAMLEYFLLGLLICHSFSYPIVVNFTNNITNPTDSTRMW
jgi:hypothetical protein